MRSARQSERGLLGIPTSSGGIARLVYARLRSSNADAASIIASAGLTIEDIEDSTRRLDAAAQTKLLEISADALQDDCLGFHLAQNMTLGEIGLVYYVMASSNRLLDAFQNAARYSTINDDGVKLRISATSSFAIDIDYIKINRIPDRHHMEFWLITLVRICRTLTGGRLVPKQIFVRHFRPSMPVEMRSHLGCDILFSCETNAILFPPKIGQLPLIAADQHLNILLLRYADEALSIRESSTASIRSRVESEIIQLLPHGRAQATEVARRLGMSRSSLSRALSTEGLGYLHVLDTLRHSLALRYLREQELPISRIAWLLGYSEVSALSHAFARWTGSTPNAYRRLQRLRGR